MDRAGRMAAGFGLVLGLLLNFSVLGQTGPKQINLLIGSGEGGGFDGSARILAQFLPRYLPGTPAVVPQNMPGASGLRVAEVIYNVSPRDGSVIGVTQPNFVLNKALDPNAKYKPQEFNWIGRLGSFTTYAVVSTKASVQTVEGARKNSLILGASGPSGPGAVLPSALNYLLGTKFNIVKGYRSAQETGLAFDRGEIPGIGSASLEFIESKHWLDKGEAKILFTIGQQRNPKYAYAPSALELMESERDRNVMKLITASTVIGRAVIAPPNMPPERVAQLREAFEKVIRDPDFLAESAKRGYDVEPLTGAELQQVVSEALSMPADVIERTRAATQGGF